MSTGLECNLIEHAPGEWFLILQDDSCPVGAWDWREYATAYGPFKTEEATFDYLHDNFANPGDYWSDRYRPNRRKDEVIEKLVTDARARSANQQSYRYGSMWR